ncbi:MAG: flagellar basal body rod C-terminal domain-containing protein [Campylobacterota bacterium]|nr:flagellar basal body rod C-terminal domain-containing protein [Campylobacterota bacterium]
MINSLHVAQTGLFAARTTVDNVMNNIANENTEGYKKRVVDLSELAHIDSVNSGRGVSVGNTVRITNTYMYDNLIQEESKNAYYGELDTMLSDIESIFFETDMSGFSSDLDRYFQAIEDLRANPYDSISRNNFENQAQILVDDLKNLYQGIEDRELVSRNSLDDSVDIVNGILGDIGKVNEQMLQQVVPSNDLLDKRDQLEKELSMYINIEVDRTNDYELKIGGLTAVRYNTNIHALNVVNEFTPQTDKYVNDANETSTIGPNGFNSADDTITYHFDNTYEITVKHGANLLDASGTPLTNNDLYGNGDNTNFVVDEDNYVIALAYEINNHHDLPSHIEVKNGIYSFEQNTNKQYTLDVDGNKIYRTAPLDNEYLVVESIIPGEDGRFEGRIVVDDADAATQTKIEVNANEIRSLKGSDDTHIEIFDEEVHLTSGSLRAITENLTTTNTYNEFTKYRDSLDAFAQTLSDISDSYLRKDDGSYTYGQKSTDLNTTSSLVVEKIGLFSGSDVESLVFNKNAVNDLSLQDLDYLATLQWKDDISFDGRAQDGKDTDGTSFSKFYQTLLVEVSSAKESNDFLQETQLAVTMSLSSSYDKLVKVDKDEEMINLIKFQAAYEANAKMITVADEMLQTLLGMKR